MPGPSIAEEISRSLARGSIHDGARMSTVTRWLRADREFNAWFLAEVKTPEVSDDAVLSVVTAYGEDQAEVEEAWNAYRDGGGLDAFSAALERSLARMAGIRAAWPARET